MSCTLTEQASAGTSRSGNPSGVWNQIKVSKELENAVQDDARRKAIDSAKKRAVAQHVDYETFQAMVSVAHLKPIERDEWHRKPNESRSSPAWNFGASGSVDSKERDGICPSASCRSREASDISDEAPKSADEFQRRWRSMSTSAEKLRYLRSIPPEKLQPLFRVEIRPGLLGEIFTALNDSWESCTGCSNATEDVPAREQMLETASRNLQSLSLEKMEDKWFGLEKEAEVEGAETAGHTNGLADAVGVEPTEADSGFVKEIEETVEMLAVLSKSGRFSLTLRLLSSAHKLAMHAFLATLQVMVQQRAAWNSEQFDGVRRSFEG